MDRFDRKILDFMRSWAPYGGPPADEVLVEFGMTRDQLIERARQIVTAERARRHLESLPPWVRARAAASSGPAARAEAAPTHRA